MSSACRLLQGARAREDLSMRSPSMESYSQFASQALRPNLPNPWKVLRNCLSTMNNNNNNNNDNNNNNNNNVIINTMC